MGTDSWASWGKTWRNHPMAPAMLSASPRMAMARFVTMPARMSETPSASTRGHAVGRGSWIAAGSVFGCWSCIAVLWLLSAEEVNNGEDDDPDGVDKMPVERKHLDPAGVFGGEAAGEREDEGQRKHDEADDDVAGVQADERVEGGAEEISADGEAVAVDELVPLMRGAAEEDASEQYRRRQPERSCGAPAVMQRRDGEVDGGAGGKQANAGEDGNIEHLAGRGPGDAFAQVVEIGHDKDDEDGGFRGDEAGHAHDAAGGKHPGLGGGVRNDGGSAQNGAAPVIRNDCRGRGDA